MIRIVLDTNLLVSAILTPQGTPAFILEHALKGTFTLIVSHGIIKEIRRVFQYPKLIKLLKRNKITSQEIDGFIEKMLKVAVITPGQVRIREIQDDPPDNRFLECAVEGQADFIISGDHHLKNLEVFQGIRIVDPATFVELINLFK